MNFPTCMKNADSVVSIMRGSIPNGGITTTARRVMCPICGWTKHEEHQWNNGTSLLLKRNESYGFGAYRLVPPGGYSGYNAFHSIPAPEVIEQIKDLLGARAGKDT